MAARMSGQGAAPHPVAPWEKSGNTSWVRCGACDGWFPVADAMLESKAVLMHCPSCHTEFTADDAARVVRAR
jgi:hypothetical protein